MPQEMNLRWLIATIILLVTFGILGWTYYQNQQNPILTQRQSTPESNTTTWLMYSNPTYGYSIDYPNGWKFFDTGNEAIVDIASYDIYDSQYERGNITGIKIQIQSSSETYTNAEAVFEAINSSDFGQTTFVKIAEEPNKVIYKNSKWEAGTSGFLEGIYQPAYVVWNESTSKAVKLFVWDPSGGFESQFAQLLDSFRFTR